MFFSSFDGATDQAFAEGKEAQGCYRNLKQQRANDAKRGCAVDR